MKYLKYLLINPLKILWMLFIFTFVGLILHYIITTDEDITIAGYIGILVFLGMVLFLAIYQPYKEWKDGIS